MQKEMLRDYIKSQNFNSTTEVMDGIKSMFSSVLNEILQCEIEESLGYSNHERVSSDGDKNYRNGSTKRKLKTELGKIEIDVPRDRNGEYEPKIIEKYQRNA